MTLWSSSFSWPAFCLRTLSLHQKWGLLFPEPQTIVLLYMWPLEMAEASWQLLFLLASLSQSGNFFVCLNWDRDK